MCVYIYILYATSVISYHYIILVLFCNLCICILIAAFAVDFHHQQPPCVIAYRLVLSILKMIIMACSYGLPTFIMGVVTLMIFSTFCLIMQG